MRTSCKNYREITNDAHISILLRTLKLTPRLVVASDSHHLILNWRADIKVLGSWQLKGMRNGVILATSIKILNAFLRALQQFLQKIRG